ncbi:hypothetical protein DL546_007910 [Coniochaeta pulveracea]|uniref:Restriction of telomere capping protein 4 n=1 Tax=Coniochaeta pulveracea TaxID=177199 RepID=A0A420YEE0_9PEZI|nr:hypothetical protein DL546_007910 [Coniochaeta pulveracea]
MPKRDEIEDWAAPPAASSDEDDINRADIKPTRFETKSKPEAKGSRTTRASARKSTGTLSPSFQSHKRLPDSDPDDLPDFVKKAKPTIDESTPTLDVGKHHKTNVLRPNNRKPPRNTFSKLDRNSRPGKFASKSTIDAPAPFLSPVKKHSFIAPEDGSLEGGSPRKNIELDRPSDHESLFGSPKKPKRKGKVRPPRRKEKQVPPKEETPKRKLELKLPSFDFDDSILDASFEELTDTQTPATKWEVERSPSPDRGPVCPMCGESVDQGLLDSFSKKKYMTITQQQKFCHAHKMQSARETWSDRKYPKIDWGRLDKRIAEHHKSLKKILKGGPSYYGAIYTQSIKDGSNRTLLKMTEDLTPGYYGTKGLRVMTEKLIEQFSALLRKAAVKDRVVSARGQTTFVQCVLVPELAVRLIMEDMAVDEEEARDIMKESISIGELLNEEEGDVVVLDDDSDSGLSSPLSSLESDEHDDSEFA